MQLWQVFFKNIFKNIKKTTTFEQLVNDWNICKHKHFPFKRNVSISIQKK